MPKDLRSTARREWKNITPILDELGLLSRVDGKALAMYCDAYADWEQAQRKCISDGMWYSEPILSGEGAVVGYKHKQSPWFNVKCTAMKMMKTYLIEFGLTPASRSRLRIEKPKSVDEFPTREESAAADAQREEADLLASVDETVLQ